MITKNLNPKGLTLGLLVLVVIISLLLSAFQLQVLRGEESLALANSISSRSEIVRAPRGLIYDRNGEVLVRNTAVFNIYALPAQLPVDSSEREELLGELAQIIGIKAEDLILRLEQRGYNSQGEPLAQRVTLVNDLDYDLYLTNYQTLTSLEGVFVATETKREYIYPQEFAHILGYLGDITEEEVEETGLDAKARVGKEGIEQSFDSSLRGEDGIRIEQSNLGGSGVSQWVPRGYKYGDNINLSIDLAWQNRLYELLRSSVSESDTALGAAAVVMEVDSGKMQAMVNYPSYDNNSFEQGISSDEFNSLLEDEQTPLLNRAIAMQIPTGSVFKILMAAPLQQEGAITAGTIYESGCFELPGDYELCEADRRDFGRLDLTDAIAKSSNPYFCQAVVDLAREKGSDELAIRELGQYFASYKLGQRTGVELPGEQPGSVPSPELKQQVTGEGWFLADLCNTVIGQGLVAATPLQMAAATAAIANEGQYMKPSLVQSVRSEDGKENLIEPESLGNIRVEQGYLDVVLSGMKQTVEEGTARQLSEVDMQIYAKTGSSEAQYTNKDGQMINGAHSWVIAIFEYDGEQYVIAVAQQFGGRGFRSVPIVKDFLESIS
ncbi:MAG: penicillin-binding transpeptidase domain-containing protein [Candidatus Dojkabacteria bacterium]